MFCQTMKAIKTMSSDSLEAIIDFKVVDETGEAIGSLHSLWSDPATGVVEYLGVKTGWLFGRNHVAPADRAELDESQSAVRLPYGEAFIKEAPSISADSEISETEEAEINAYYQRGAAPTSLTDARTDPTLPAESQRWTRIQRPPTGEDTPSI